MKNLLARLQRFAAFGAMGAAGGLMAAWLGLVWFVRPVPTGGMEPVTHFVVTSSSFVVFAMLASAHLWFGLQLKRGPSSITG